MPMKRFDDEKDRRAKRSAFFALKGTRGKTHVGRVKSHIVLFDYFFTSVQLIQDLLKDRILACGTARQDRKQFPQVLSITKLKIRLAITIIDITNSIYIMYTYIGVNQ